MLTLSRKVHETIRIGNDIEILIKRIDGDIVKIGIVAPADVPILRGELFTEVQTSNLGAVTSPDATGVAEALRALGSSMPTNQGSVEDAAGESVK